MTRQWPLSRIRSKSSWDAELRVGNRRRVAENWQPQVEDFARMRISEANAGHAVAPRSNSANVIGRIVFSSSRFGMWWCRAVSLHYEIASLEEEIAPVVR